MNSSPPTDPTDVDLAPACWSCGKSIFRGSIGFALVGIIGFSVWALGGRWLYGKVGEVGMYVACLSAFLIASGLLLSPLVQGPRRLARFYKIFIPAFVAYAVIWSVAWFALRFGTGEWLGSFLGSAAFAAMTGWGFGTYRGLGKSTVVLFAVHSAGYFLGGKLMYWLMSPAGVEILTGLTKPQVSIVAKLSWGLLYGLGFGAGIGYVFHNGQKTAVSELVKPLLENRFCSRK